MITVLSIGNGYIQPEKKEFLISSSSDVADLPTAASSKDSDYGRCAPGSVAYTADLSKLYMLGADDEWHAVI